MNGKRTPQRRLTGDDGSVIVEFAFAAPILLFLVLGMFDFVIREFMDSQLSSATADGARVGVLKYLDADDSITPSANYTAVKNAVKQRMANTVVNTVVVKCYDDLTTDEIDCANGVAIPGSDTIAVTATATFRPVSFVGRTLWGSSRTVTSTSRMIIVGLPS